MKCTGVIIGLAFALGTHVEAAEMKVISTGGARAVMTSIVPEFERKSGHKVGIDFGTPGNMRDRLLQGEAADVAVAIAAILPDLEKAGKIAPGTRMEFAASYVGDRKSTRLNSSHANISYAVFCLKKKTR